MKAYTLISILTLFILSCKEKDNSDNQNSLMLSKQENKKTEEQSFDGKYAIDSMRIGEFSLCDNIDSLIVRNREYSKKIFEEEDQRWIGYYFKLNDSKWVLVESRGEKSSKISRISTNSQLYRMANGIRCGMTVESILNTKIDFNVNLELRVFSFYIPTDGVALVVKNPFIDIKNMDKVESGDLSKEEIIKALNKKSIIEKIVIIGPCSK